MEWDKFWSTNKKKYEQTAHRYMGVFEETCVELHIEGAPSGEIVSIPVQLHPKVSSLRLSSCVLCMCFAYSVYLMVHPVQFVQFVQTPFPMKSKSRKRQKFCPQQRRTEIRQIFFFDTITVKSSNLLPGLPQDRSFFKSRKRAIWTASAHSRSTEICRETKKKTFGLSMIRGVDCQIFCVA